MEIPRNLDAFLAALLANDVHDVPAPCIELDEDERAFVDGIMDSVMTGSIGIFVMLHPNDAMQFVLLNTSRAQTMTVLATVIQRIVEALEADAD